MTGTLAERFTAQFYEWERIGRGWDIYSTPVDIEPPFYPFYHAVPQASFVDDGKVPTLFDRAANLFKTPSAPLEVTEEEPLAPYPFEDNSLLHVLSVSLPKDYNVRVPDTEQLLLMLSYCKSQVSFEIIANSSSIRIQLVCRVPDVPYVA